MSEIKNYYYIIISIIKDNVFITATRYLVILFNCLAFMIYVEFSHNYIHHQFISYGCALCVVFLSL